MSYKSHLLTLETIGYSWIQIHCSIGPRGRFYSFMYHVIDVGTGDVFG